MYAVGIVANLVLARLLVPRDFGLVALGTTVLVFGSYVAYGGFSAALIRRREPPDDREMQAIFGLQLTLAVFLALAVTAVAVPAGDDGLVVATMACAIPLIVIRTPSVIVLERRLEYRLIATSDVAEGLVYYLWAVGTVAAGLGVWGMATAAVVRAVVGSAVLVVAGPIRLVRPRWDLAHVRPLIGFGLKFQAATVVLIAREQLLNVAIAAVAGLATLGVWNLAWRVLQVPTLLFATVGRVAFPAFSRLLDSRDDMRAAVERALAALTAMTGILVVALVGLAPGLPAVVGDGWEGVPAVLLWSGIALILSAPIAVVGSGYLYAAGEAGRVALATLASSAVWLAITLPLLDDVGAAAVGIGWVPASLVYAAIIWRRTVALTGAARLGRVGRGTAVALAAACTGWLVAHSVSGELAGAALGLVAGEVIALAGLLAFARAAVRDLLSLTRSAWR